MWRCVDLVWSDVSEERIASTFRVEKSASEEPAWAGGCRLMSSLPIAEHYVCSHLLTLVPRLRNFLPWRWRWYFPPKPRYTQDLHSSTSQKTEFFIVTAVKTRNLTTLPFAYTKVHNLCILPSWCCIAMSSGRRVSFDLGSGRHVLCSSLA
jgi:hypothetical protein